MRENKRSRKQLYVQASEKGWKKEEEEGKGMRGTQPEKMAII